MHLNGTQLQFLSRLSKTPDGLMLLQVLQAKLAESDLKLRSATGEEVYRAQGRAQAFDEMIADLTKADDRLTRTTPSVTSRNLRAA
jgi:hypothetical protein